MLVMGSITSLLHNHWELSAPVRGMMVSIVFLGFCGGNLVSGSIGDRYGRKRSILLSYLFIGVFGMLTAFSWDAVSMVILRFMVGFGCGIGFPSVYSLIPEVCPTNMRGPASTLMIGCMPLGELFAALGVMLIDPYLDRSVKHCEIYGSGISGERGSEPSNLMHEPPMSTVFVDSGVNADISAGLFRRAATTGIQNPIYVALSQLHDALG